MTIQNDFLEFLQQPRCKIALMIMTLIVFLTLSIQEIRGVSSSFLQTTALSLITFWAGRASKAGIRRYNEK